jgi:sugar phosphate isomerase/epimerase
MNSHTDIRIGTVVLVLPNVDTLEYIRQILPHGFESFQIFFWQTIGDVNLEKFATDLKRLLAEAGDTAVISSVGCYGNPLTDEQNAADLGRLIDAAPVFGCDVVGCFAGRAEGASVPDSMPRFREVFGPLADRAADQGVRIAFENCAMGGDWQGGGCNIAHSPSAWEMMFNEVPADNLGLEWEPCHQLLSLIDPIAQLRQWAPKVFHVHGKDANVDRAQLRAGGLRGNKPFAWDRTAGFGDSNWTDIISILRHKGFRGAIDIEGRHDPVYKGELEMTGQIRALHYLKQCRGGAFVPNPE